MAAADPTPAHLARLDPDIAYRAWYLVYAARVAGYPLIITSSARDSATQRALVAEGRSRTLNSKHLTGHAFDVDWYGWHRDDVPMEFWHLLGPYAERHLGLKWGGRFTSIRDFGHFEI